MKKMLLTMIVGLWGSLALAGEFDLPGYVTEVEDGRLWVFKAGSAELEEFKKHGEPAKQFTQIGAGPNGMTVKSADPATLEAYLKAHQQK